MNVLTTDCPHCHETVRPVVRDDNGPHCPLCEGQVEF